MTQFTKETKLDLKNASNYFNVSENYIFRELSELGLYTFGALNQPPFLTPEYPQGVNSRKLFSKLNGTQQPVNAYFGIGGDTEPYRSFLFLLAMGKYQNGMKKLSGLQPKVILYDAFLYDRINKLKTDRKKHSEIFKKTEEDLRNANDKIDIADPKGWRGSQILRYIASEALEKISQLDDASRLKIERRRRIFQKMCDTVGLDVRIISSSEFLADEKYRDKVLGLIEGMKYASRRNSSILGWSSLVPVSLRENATSLLYVPMEIAEALLLNEMYDVKVKIGDKKEKGFDQFISKEKPELLFAYTIPAITSAGEKPPYRNKSDINFDMTLEEAKKFLNSSPPEVLSQFELILRELGVEVKDVIGQTLELFSEIKGGVDGKI